jgi:hypothetical protein
MTSRLVHQYIIRDDSNDNLVELLEDETTINHIYPCLNGIDTRLPNCMVLLTGSYPNKEHISITKVVKKKKFTRHTWEIDLKYNKEQWKFLLNWGREYTLDLMVSNSGIDKDRIPLLRNVPLNSKFGEVVSLPKEKFVGIQTANFKKAYLKICRINKQIEVKITLIESAFW